MKETEKLIELDDEVDRLNQQILILQATRDVTILKAIKEGNFKDSPEYNYWSMGLETRA